MAKISALRVLSRTTAVYYKRAQKPLPEIARELAVEGVVEGTVLRSGDRVRISAQLLHGPTDAHLWAETYDRDLRDVMALQSEVAQAIARQVEAKVTPHEQEQLDRTRQVNPEVYEDYLKGRYYWNKRTVEGMSKGAEYFQRVIERDPGYAPAYAGLAHSAARLGWWGHVAPEEGCARAITLALKALEIDDTLADAHAAHAFALLHYDCSFPFESAEKACRRAVELDPRSSAAAQAYACFLLASGHPEEGVVEVLRGAQLDPLSLALQWTASAILYHARQYDRAIAQSRRCLELDPSFPPPWFTIGIALAKKRTNGSGFPELEEAVKTSGSNQVILGGLGIYHAALGRQTDALRVLQQFEVASHTQRYVSGYWPAAICACLGKKDEAFRLLESAYRERAPWMAYTKVAPYFDDLRSDSRFDALLRRMNFPP